MMNILKLLPCTVHLHKFENLNWRLSNILFLFSQTISSRLDIQSTGMKHEGIKNKTKKHRRLNTSTTDLSCCGKTRVSVELSHPGNNAWIKLSPGMKQNIMSSASLLSQKLLAYRYVFWHTHVLTTDMVELGEMPLKPWIRWCN